MVFTGIHRFDVLQLLNQRDKILQENFISKLQVMGNNPEDYYLDVYNGFVFLARKNPAQCDIGEYCRTERKEFDKSLGITRMIIEKPKPANRVDFQKAGNFVGAWVFQKELITDGTKYETYWKRIG